MSAWRKQMPRLIWVLAERTLTLLVLSWPWHIALLHSNLTILLIIRAATWQNQQNGIRPVWSVSSLPAWRKLGSLATHSVNSEDSDQTGWMPRLIWVFTGHTLTLLVLSYLSSIYNFSLQRFAGMCNQPLTHSFSVAKRVPLIMILWPLPWCCSVELKGLS